MSEARIFSIRSSVAEAVQRKELVCEDFEAAKRRTIAQRTGSEEEGAQTASSLPQRPAAQSAVVGRLVIQSLGSAKWGFDTGTPKAAADLLRLVHRLKGMVRGSSIAVMLSVPTGAFPILLRNDEAYVRRDAMRLDPRVSISH